MLVAPVADNSTGACGPHAVPDLVSRRIKKVWMMIKTYAIHVFEVGINVQ